MAWIHNEDFDILQTLNEQHDWNDYFEVDDMIAAPVAELNRRNYFTTDSCAGHPFQTETVVDTRPEKEYSLEELFEELFEEPDESETIIRFRTFATQRSYVTFEEPLPDTVGVPEGWHYSSRHRALYCHYRKTPNPYVFAKNQAIQMMSLMRWALNLPRRTFG